MNSEKQLATEFTEESRWIINYRCFTQRVKNDNTSTSILSVSSVA